MPIASLDHFNPEYMGFANLVEESEARCVHITGIENKGRTMSILVRGSNKLMIDEAERSLHDALCVIRCLVKKRWVFNQCFYLTQSVCKRLSLVSFYFINLLVVFNLLSFY